MNTRELLCAKTYMFFKQTKVENFSTFHINRNRIEFAWVLLMNGIIYTAVNCIETRQCGGKIYIHWIIQLTSVFLMHTHHKIEHQFFLKYWMLLQKVSKLFLFWYNCFSNWVMTYRKELYTWISFVNISYTFLFLSVKTFLFSSPKWEKNLILQIYSLSWHCFTTKNLCVLIWKPFPIVYRDSSSYSSWNGHKCQNILFFV